MICETKLGTVSVIRDVLKLKPKTVRYDTLTTGEYFEYLGSVFIYIGKGKSIDQNGFVMSFTNEFVHPIRVKIEYDYRLLGEDGKEEEL